MFFGPSTPEDPPGGHEAWDPFDLSGAAYEDADIDAMAREHVAHHAPDTLDHLIEVADMMTMQAAQRLIGVDLLRREALADAARRGRVLTDVVERSVRLEIACALRITESESARLLTLAETLVDRYPDVLDSFAGARMSERHAQIIVDAVEVIEPQFREKILPRAIDLAESQPVGSFRRDLRRLVETVRSATLAERHEAALKRRRVYVQPEDDGMAWFTVFLPAVEAHAIFTRTTAIAKVIVAQDGETRTLGQTRADVVADLLIEGDIDAHPREARGIRATVAVTVPALGLLSDELAAEGEPASVEGVGPIPMQRARELCGGSRGWMRILTHPETGIVLSVGREHYRPPPGLRRLVKWRAERCMAPGCGVEASRCEIDHRLAWEHGGETSLENLNPFCKGHHIVKHHGDWLVEDIPGSGGAVAWISPTGRRYVVQPARSVPVFRAQSHNDAPF